MTAQHASAATLTLAYLSGRGLSSASRGYRSLKGSFCEVVLDMVVVRAGARAYFGPRP